MSETIIPYEAAPSSIEVEQLLRALDGAALVVIEVHLFDLPEPDDLLRRRIARAESRLLHDLGWLT